MIRRMSTHLAMAVWIAFSVSLVSADTATLSPSKDNTLVTNANGEVSNGAGFNIFSGRTGAIGPGAIRSLIAFDIAGGVPAGSIITGVELALTITNSNDDFSRDHSLHRVSQDWGEGTSVAVGGNGAPATPGDATWIHTFFDSATWATAGGDFVSAASATTAVSEVVGAMATWSSTGDLVTDVQDWLDDPSTNFGWILIGDEANSRTARGFGSKEALMGTPTLTVTYQVPEPGSLLLTALALICGLGFRRR